jgi:serine protease Do
MNNWIKTAALVVTAALISTFSFGQTAKEKSQKEQDIIIRKKGDKAGKTTIVIDGDNVTINGKPIDEYKSEDLTVLRRSDVERLAPRVRALTTPRGSFRMDGDAFGGGAIAGTNKAMLGVMTDKAENGAKVVDVTKESAAEKAGLKEGDVITKVGDTKIENPQDLIEAIGKRKPNDKVDLTYKRDNKESKVNVTLGENKARAYAFNFDRDNLNFDFPTPNGPGNFFSARKPKIGLQIQDLETGKGVTVKDVDEDSPAAKAGLKEGDVITDVNGKEVAGVDELRNEIKDLKEGDPVRFKYKRGNNIQTVEVKLPKKLRTADL